MPCFYINVNESPIVSYTTYQAASEASFIIAETLAGQYHLRNPEWRTTTVGQTVYKKRINSFWERDSVLFRVTITETPE